MVSNQLSKLHSFIYFWLKGIQHILLIRGTSIQSRIWREICGPVIKNVALAKDWSTLFTWTWQHIDWSMWTQLKY